MSTRKISLDGHCKVLAEWLNTLSESIRMESEEPSHSRNRCRAEKASFLLQTSCNPQSQRERFILDGRCTLKLVS